MNSRLHKEILTEAYKDMQKLIAGVAWNFWSIRGGDLDDLIGQANLIFIDAFNTYDPSRGTKLATWLTFKIKRGLFDYIRNGNVYEQHTSIDDEFAEIYPALSKDFSVMELLDEMEHYAHIVLQLFLETPKEIIIKVLNKQRRIDHTQAHLRNRLMNRLRQMGWTVRRMRAAFEEIKNATSY